jgi:hypothetical protein
MWEGLQEGPYFRIDKGGETYLPGFLPSLDFISQGLFSMEPVLLCFHSASWKLSAVWISSNLKVDM